MKKLFWVFLFLFAGCISFDDQNIVQETENPLQQIIEEKPSEVLQNLLNLHNEKRTYKGRSELELDLFLCEYAQKHADWMASKNNLQHSTISNLFGNYSHVAENIAWNQRSEIKVVEAWMNSRGHRANIMNNQFGKIGFGVAYNANGEPYWCTVFGN